MASEKLLNAFAHITHYDMVDSEIKDNEIEFTYISIVQDVVCNGKITDDTVEIRVNQRDWKAPVTKICNSYQINADLLGEIRGSNEITSLSILGKLREYLNSVIIDHYRVEIDNDDIIISKYIKGYNEFESVEYIHKCIEYLDKIILNMFIIVSPDELEAKIEDLIDCGTVDEEEIYIIEDDCIEGVKDDAIYKYLLVKWDEDIIRYPGIYTDNCIVAPLFIGDYLFYAGSYHRSLVSEITKVYGYKWNENSNPPEETSTKGLMGSDNVMIGKNWITSIKNSKRIKLNGNGCYLSMNNSGYITIELNNGVALLNGGGENCIVIEDDTEIGRVVGDRFILDSLYYLDKFKHYLVLSLCI